MTNFLRSCCCQGRQPEGVVAARHVPRTDLIARMLRQRDVARFLVAPPGSGRTTLAGEYAGIVFGFKHVFWVPCTSPCFLRDLDAGTLASGIFAIDDAASLVVWEDLPHLDADRAQAFGILVDDLLQSGVEVVATCTPLADAFAGSQRDRVCLGAADLLLSDAEMRAEEAAGRVREHWEVECLPADRIACMRWGEGARGTLLEGVTQEEMPSDLRLAILVLLVLGKGSVDELSRFMGAERAEEAARYLEEHYPLFGLDGRIGAFHALEAEPAAIAEAYGRGIDACAEASHHATRDALCAHLADLLMAQERVPRAAEVAAAFLSKPAMGDWVVRNGYRILMSGHPRSFSLVDANLRQKAVGLGGELGALRAWAAFMLGNTSPGALESGRQPACPTSTPRSRLSAAVLATRCALGDERMQAAAAIRACLDAAAALPLAANEADALRGDAMDWGALGAVAAQLAEGPSHALSRWFECWAEAEGSHGGGSEAKARRNALLLGGAWILDEHTSVAYVPSKEAMERCLQGHAEGMRAMGSLDDVARFARDAIEDEAARGPLGWCATMAGEALERLGAEQPRFMAYLPAPESSARIHEAEVALFEQRESLRRSVPKAPRARAALRTGQVAAGAPWAMDDAAQACPLGAPLLHVRLFGGLEVRIGDRMVFPVELSRHKTRLLLALLVLSHGHESSRTRIAELLWPASSPKSAMKNFYSVWSQLRRALSVNGECPYLLRTREGCRLDDRLVVADIDQFEELCRSLQFRQGEDQDWERLYTQVCTDYGEDLLPCDRGNELVDAKRQHYHSLLVEALVSASRWLGRNGDPRGALWFAREGLRRDDQREDVYLALMESQVLSGQRCDAMETYFSCRRFLSEELGIDPSARLVELYRSVIETEQALV